MARTVQDKCDGPGCTNVRKETNHWFVFIPIELHSGFVVRPFRFVDLEPDEKFACGEACLLKIISEHIKNDTAKT